MRRLLINYKVGHMKIVYYSILILAYSILAYILFYILAILLFFLVTLVITNNNALYSRLCDWGAARCCAGFFHAYSMCFLVN